MGIGFWQKFSADLVSLPSNLLKTSAPQKQYEKLPAHWLLIVLSICTCIDFPRPSRFPSDFALGKYLGCPGSTTQYIPPLGRVRTYSLRCALDSHSQIINPSLGNGGVSWYRMSIPMEAISIDSVKINTSLEMVGKWMIINNRWNCSNIAQMVLRPLLQGSIHIYQLRLSFCLRQNISDRFFNFAPHFVRIQIFQINF